MHDAAGNGIPVDQTKKGPYPTDEIVGGRAMECGAFEAPWATPPDSTCRLPRPPEGGPPAPSEVVIGFQGGVPVSLDGAALPVHELILALGAKVGAYGFGRLDMVENRRVGCTSRDVYECTGDRVLNLAYTVLVGV